MDITRDILSLTEFKRRSAELLAEMKRENRPLVLTVNGRAELVVQDAKSYQRMADLAARLEALEGVERGLQSMREGKGRSARATFAALEAKHPYLTES